MCLIIRMKEDQYTHHAEKPITKKDLNELIRTSLRLFVEMQKITYLMKK